MKKKKTNYVAMLGQMYHLIKDTGKTKQEINNELEEMGYLFMNR